MKWLGNLLHMLVDAIEESMSSGDVACYGYRSLVPGVNSPTAELAETKPFILSPHQ